MEPAQYSLAARDVSTVDNEIDLHIEALRADYASLSSAEKLNEQLKATDAYLQRALIAGHHRVYLIHGIGSGKLRQAIHTLLADYPHVKSFRNAFHPRYGLGATEVRF
jgi:dsDNA-specific endonuclease/ATPase MutS2